MNIIFSLLIDEEMWRKVDLLKYLGFYFASWGTSITRLAGITSTIETVVSLCLHRSANRNPLFE